MLVGQWHDFPTTPEEIAQTFREIGIDGVRYEEFFVTDFECDIGGVIGHLGEYIGLDELNYLASQLDGLSKDELAVYQAVVETGEHSGSLQDLINLADSLDCFDFIPTVNDDYDLGHYWLEESGCYDLENMGDLTRYIDYERFGRDIRFDEGGTFTNGGYVRDRSETFHEHYDGMHVPEEYQVLGMLAEDQVYEQTTQVTETQTFGEMEAM